MPVRFGDETDVGGNETVQGDQTDANIDETDTTGTGTTGVTGATTGTTGTTRTTGTGKTRTSTWGGRHTGIDEAVPQLKKQKFKREMGADEKEHEEERLNQKRADNEKLVKFFAQNNKQGQGSKENKQDSIAPDSKYEDRVCKMRGKYCWGLFFVSLIGVLTMVLLLIIGAIAKPECPANSTMTSKTTTSITSPTIKPVPTSEAEPVTGVRKRLRESDSIEREYDD